MNDVHRCLVVGVAVTATHASDILTVNIDKKCEILLVVRSKGKKREILLAVSSKDRKREISLAASSKDRKYRADRMAAQKVEYIITEEKTTQQLYFENEQIDTMKDVSMPQMSLFENKNSSTTSEKHR